MRTLGRAPDPQWVKIAAIIEATAAKNAAMAASAAHAVASSPQNTART